MRALLPSLLCLALPTHAAAGAAPASTKAAAPKPVVATATLQSRSNSTVTGLVTFTQTGTEMKVHIEVKGATAGNHAVHIHEKGDCSAADASSAGSHFNPEAKAHGDMTMPMHHPGDFGNLTVGSEGTGVKDLTTTGITFTAGQLLTITNLSVIVHEKPDDFSQPTGNAGGRQACGVITLQ